uniref:Protein kinase domain-containing protein n=1 Tax=Lactuca sativa TaxID=4236 RepID=A0A9R1XI98_LACSA|nr:hypothetical protein LSAT_V11C400222530 [Lactuca sativa]
MDPKLDARSQYSDAFLNALEVFKLRKNGSLAGHNLKLRPTSPSPPQPSPSGEKRTPPYRVKRSGDKSSDEQKSKDFGLLSDRCHREFEETHVIRRGGFGMVYIRHVDNHTTIVAIK